MPWQAGADVHADGHVHSAFGAKRILETPDERAGAELRSEDDTGYRHDSAVELREWME